MFSPYVEGKYGNNGKGEMGGGFRMSMPLCALVKAVGKAFGRNRG